MKFFIKVFTTYIIAIALAMVLVGCGEELGIEDVSGSANSDVGAPTSLIGKTVVMKVETADSYSASGGKLNTLQIGGQMTYTLIDQSTILGDGVQQIPSISWDYNLNGNVGTLNIEMEYGTSEDVYTFTSPTSGTWTNYSRLVSGSSVSYTGTFTTSYYTGTSNSTSTNSGTTTTSSVTSGTGQIAVWSSRTTTETGSISVSIDYDYAGSLTQYFYSTPTCGDSGTVTKTVPSGTHSISAVDGTTTWNSGTISVSSGGCSTYELY